MNRLLPVVVRLGAAVFLAFLLGTATGSWPQAVDKNKQDIPQRSQEKRAKGKKQTQGAKQESEGKSSSGTPDLSFYPSGPNLAPNGDFSKGGKFPESWEPMPPHVEWIDVGGEHGKAIHFIVPRDVARTYGVKYLSDYIEIKPNHTYTFNFDFKKTGGISLTAYVEGYMEHEGSRRKIYDAPAFVYAPGKDWTRYGRRKPLTAATPDGRPVKWFRFKLYAYGGDAGEAWWDNIHLEELTAAPEKDL